MTRTRKDGLALLLALVLAGGTLLWSVPAWAAPLTAQETDRPSQALEALLAAAFSVEYGDAERDYLLRWQRPVKVSLTGDYLPEDEAFLDAFLLEITEMAEAYNMTAFPGISRAKTKREANLRVIYCPLDEMAQHLKFYEPDNWGYFEYYFENYRLTKATVVVSTDVTNQEQRNHLLMEEIVGSLGLTNDIDDHPDSIVYQPWTETQQLSDLDWLMLSYLYHKDVRPGMTSRQAYQKLLPLVQR